MTIKFETYYRHRKKGFRVVVGPPAWWDVSGRAKIPDNAVLVMRCGLSDGPTKWLMSAESFEKNYESDPEE